MKECKDCNEYGCGAQGSDNISATCGNTMTKFNTGAVREDKTGKGRCDLLPMCALIRLSKHYEKGSVDHGERNWEKGIPMHSFLDSAIRHLFKYVDGQTDEDHLVAAAWNILGAMWTEEKHPRMQDIPSRMVEFNENASPYARRAASLDREYGGGTNIASPTRSQEKATPVQEDKCTCWHPELKSYTGLPQCWGTKEAEGCTCDGDLEKCDFYDLHEQ